MTAKEKAEELRERCDGYKCYALVAVDNIIASNPHSNPLNTEVHSTMQFWQEVREELVDKY